MCSDGRVLLFTPKSGHLFLESGAASCRCEINTAASTARRPKETGTEEGDHKDPEPWELHKSKGKCSPTSLLEHS